MGRKMTTYANSVELRTLEWEDVYCNEGTCLCYRGPRLQEVGGKREGVEELDQCNYHLVSACRCWWEQEKGRKQEKQGSRQPGTRSCG